MLKCLLEDVIFCTLNPYFEIKPPEGAHNSVFDKQLVEMLYLKRKIFFFKDHFTFSITRSIGEKKVKSMLNFS